VVVVVVVVVVVGDTFIDDAHPYSMEYALVSAMFCVPAVPGSVSS
jgi:hypothetical protein